MLNREEIEHIAALAHLQLDEAEIARMQQQLSAILGYMQMLREVDTSMASATAQVLPLENVTRPDEITPSIPREESLGNAPAEQDGLFCVPPVLE